MSKAEKGEYISWGDTEEELCDTFEELRDRVFSEAMRENVEED